MKVTKQMAYDVAFHCDTKEKANELLSKAHRMGFKWSEGDSYLDNNYYEEYKENTCYTIHEGKYGSIENYYNEDYKIIEYILDSESNIDILLNIDKKLSLIIIKNLAKIISDIPNLETNFVYDYYSNSKPSCYRVIVNELTIEEKK